MKIVSNFWVFCLTQVCPGNTTQLNYLRSLQGLLDFFYKVRHLIHLETLKILYYPLFYSFVSYEITVLGLTHKSSLDPIIIAPKKNFRVMTYSEINAHTAPFFSQLGILKVHDIHQFQLLSFVYDCHNKIAPAHFHSYFKPSSAVHNYNARMASRGGLFLQRKIHFSIELDVYNTLVQGCGT